MKLNNKTILITGASGGIGRAVALKCAQDKCTLILSARNKAKLEELKKEVEKLGSEAYVITADITKPEEIKNLFLETLKKVKQIDVVFNNAGLGYIASIHELTVDQISNMIDVNVKGMILVTKYASEVMTRQNFGHIIMTSSLAGLITLPQWSVYVASKWAIKAFADSIRPELKAFNVHVTTIHPGVVKTEFFSSERADLDINKLGDAITPEQVADEVYDAMLTDNNRVVVPGYAKIFAGIYKFLPEATNYFISRMGKGVEYHENIEEDEKEFDKAAK